MFLIIQICRWNRSRRFHKDLSRLTDYFTALLDLNVFIVGKDNHNGQANTFSQLCRKAEVKQIM